MKKKWALFTLVGTTAALAAMAVPVAGASAESVATPVVTGCPAGFSLFATATPPYRVAAALDNPANGGNGDGYVCAHALPDAVRDAFCARGLLGYCFLKSLGLPIYQFREDDNPAKDATAAVTEVGG
jgi:hypothetical protein